MREKCIIQREKLIDVVARGIYIVLFILHYCNKRIKGGFLSEENNEIQRDMHLYGQLI